MTRRSLGSLYGPAILGVLLGGICSGQPPLTAIHDTLYKADGTTFEGVLMINWRSFEAPDSSNIPTNSLTAQVVRGNLSVRLVPTTTAPAPAYYSVRYVSEGSIQFSEVWNVPVSAQPLRVRDVRVAWPPNPVQPPAAIEDIQIEDVDGLRQELDIRPTKGLTYLPSRVAVIGATGELEAAAGELSDCVRVDGSTGPCGASGIGFVDSESPGGQIDGVNTTFTLAGTPDPAGSLLLSRNGVLLKQGLDYSTAANVITFSGAAIPQDGDSLLASYRVDSSLTAALGIVDAETPIGTIDGSNPTFALAGTPSPATSLLLHRNGLLLKAGEDYSLTGNSITFLPEAIPQPGDVLLATYRVPGL